MAKASEDDQRKFLQDVRKAYPGVSVPVAGGAASVVVYPVGLRHLERFARVVSAAVMTATQAIAQGAVEMPGLGAPPDAKPTVRPARLQAVIPAIVGAVFQEMVGIVAECCTPDPSDLPHWDFAPVVSAWIDLNFGEEARVRPWVRVIETILLKTTGAEVDLWETVSKSWSPAVTSFTRSFTGSSQGGPTEGGARSSSMSDSQPASDSSESAGHPS